MLNIDPDRTPVAPRHAATVILLREESRGFSVFMVRRHAKSGFMAGAYVFPGGTLDEEDCTVPRRARVVGRTEREAAATLGEDDGVLALGLFVAATRETFEEAGVLLADGAGALELSEARARLHAGADFASVVNELGVALRIDELTPWARWVTPKVERRRYDARFFVARAPADQRAAHDRIEVTAGEWLRPNQALDRWQRGELGLPPPTLRTLEHLVSLDTVESVLAHAQQEVPRPIEPEFVTTGETVALVLPGDPAHSIAEPRIAGPSRFVLIDGVFRSCDP